MRYNKLDLNLLFALKALLTEKSVTRAGESVHVTQSAMSSVLARLREYFDDPLIVQVGRRMELTPLAGSLMEPVNDVLMRIDATIATRPEFNPATSRRHFSIIASDYVMRVMMVDVLREVHRKAPCIMLEFHQPTETAAADLDTGEVDFIIIPERFTSPTASGHVLFEDTYTMVVDLDNHQVGDTVTLEQYLTLGHVAYQSRRSGLPMFETWFDRQHGDGRRVKVAASGFHLLPHLVIGTDHIATLQTRLTAQYVQQLPVRPVRPLFEVPRLVEVLQWHRYRDHDPGSAWLRERIIAGAQALRAPEALL
jgi:LysR family transcriptional regulator, nod-box dependent transcriptional activator